MAKNDNLNDFLVDLADGIRAAEGSTANIDPQDFRQRIEDIVDTATSDATALAGDILEHRTAYIDGEKVTGTMPYNLGNSHYLDAGESYTIPVGYHAGNSTVTANDLYSQTLANATPDQIREGYNAWVKGEKIYGTMPDVLLKAPDITFDAETQMLTASYVMPDSGYVTARDTPVASSRLITTIEPNLSSNNIRANETVFGTPGTFTSDATATAEDILIGKRAYVKGKEVNGTMVDRGEVGKSLNAGESYTIPAGYHNGSGKVTANGLASQTSATATAGDVLTDKTAYVNGTKITGSMTNNGAVSKSLNAGGSYAIPAGYHNGSGKVTANSLASQTSATAAAGDILSGKTAYVNGNKVTGTIVTKTSSNLTASGATVSVPAGYYASAASKSVTTATQTTPSVSVNASGLITASATQSAGYVTAGTKSATKQLTTQAAKTITPSTSTQTAVAKNVYTTGAVTVAGDANLAPANIAYGKTIFNKTGTFSNLAAYASGSLNDLNLRGATYLRNYAFSSANINSVVIPDTVTSMGGACFAYCSGLKEVVFEGTPSGISGDMFSNCNQSDLVINVPWTEGAISGAPWGATNATINYSSYGPGYSQLVEGYSFDYSDPYPASKLSGTRIQVKNITDSTAKAAIKAAGKSDDDYILQNPSTGGIALPITSNCFVPGRRYRVSVTYYTPSGGGGGQYFIIKDGSAGNHAIKSNMFYITEKVATSTCIWTVSDTDWEAIWYEIPGSLYILDINIQIDTSTDYHYAKSGVRTVTASELAAGYKFDFSGTNIPVSGIKHWIDVSRLDSAAKSVMTSANGFGSSVIHIRQDEDIFSFSQSMSGIFTAGGKYTVKMRIYAPTKDIGGMVMLAMNTSGTQVESAQYWLQETGVTNVYDMGYTIKTPSGTQNIQFFRAPFNEIYIGNITVSPA